MDTSREDVGISIRSALLDKGTKQKFSLLALVILSIIFIFVETIETKPLNIIRSFIKDTIYRGSVVVSDSDAKEALDETRNRFPEILRDVKLLLSDVIIADFHRDTLEVIYTLSRIYDLLMEADQIGEKNLEDQEEFVRFESSFMDIYNHKLSTIRTSDAPITAERIRKDVNETLDPIEIEMGDTKFIVVDDRDGHIPLVRNKQVDQFINYFQNKGRSQFEIWLKRYA